MFVSYGLAIVFGILGTSMLFMRTRYAISLYLVIFAYLVVIAYKIGMVHERVLKSEASTMGDQSPEAFRPDIGPATTMEVGP